MEVNIWTQWNWHTKKNSKNIDFPPSQFSWNSTKAPRVFASLRSPMFHILFRLSKLCFRSLLWSAVYLGMFKSPVWDSCLKWPQKSSLADVFSLLLKQTPISPWRFWSCWRWSRQTFEWLNNRVGCVGCSRLLRAGFSSGKPMKSDVECQELLFTMQKLVKKWNLNFEIGSQNGTRRKWWQIEISYIRYNVRPKGWTNLVLVSIAVENTKLI